MIIGHFAVAFGAKKFVPEVSLGTLFLASQLADAISPPLILLGVESIEVEPGITVMMPLNLIHYPYSHSLVALALWSLMFATVYMVLTRSGLKTAIVIAVLGVSHWMLDVLMHRPDLPISLTGSARLGLGLWNHPIIGVPVELLLFGAGVWLYARHTRPRNRRGSLGMWALTALLLLTYVATHFGPPLPSAASVAWSGQFALWFFVFWAFWLDRQRERRLPA